jgi:cyclic pyranopterin phosphate synthase
MPSEKFGPGHSFLPRREILTYEEIDAVVAALLPLGLQKVRITGGEPLLRRDLQHLVSMLASHGIEVALTTNGLLLENQAAKLAAAGLNRVTVSLDALDPVIFESITETPGSKVTNVLSGISAALDAGLAPVKVNAVIRRDINESEIIRLVDRFHGTEVEVRFIEFMDVGNCNGWRLDEVVTTTEMRAILAASGYQLEPREEAYRGEVAKRWQHVDGGGQVGFISSISEPFCGDCTRQRLTADGHIFTCLFANQGFDLRPLLRANSNGEEAFSFSKNTPQLDQRLPVEIIDTLAQRLESIWHNRTDNYSEGRTEMTKSAGVKISLPRVEMSYIGG